MKACPTCGATTGDDEILCEVDGSMLAPIDESPSDRAITMAPAGIVCPACRATGAGEVDGRCAACGFRFGAEHPTLPVVPLSPKLGVCDIVGARGVGDFVVRGERGEMTLALGGAGSLVGEARALEALGGAPPFPTLIDDGNTVDGASFVAVTAPPAGARRVTDLAPSLSIGDATAVVRAVLDVARRVEAVGYSWHPDLADLWSLPDGAIALARLRGAEPLAGGRLDARGVLEAIGPAFVPEPIVRGVPRLVHLLLPNVDSDVARDVDATRALLDAAVAEIAAPVEAGLAALRDAGLRRDHNEDAFALESSNLGGEPWTALVVCDGVSASAHAAEAANTASAIACAALSRFARSDDFADDAVSRAMFSAIREAHLAICTSPLDHPDDNAPGTTLVAGFVYQNRLTVGWVGDSRAYFVSSSDAELLTQDHSWAGEAVARGEMTHAEAMRAPLAHALTRCLGPLEDDERDAMPDIRSRALDAPGHVVLCTDGFWNYFPDALTVAALVRELGPDARPAAIARHLVNHALARGGHDNVTVAVYAHPR